MGNLFRRDPYDDSNYGLRYREVRVDYIYQIEDMWYLWADKYGWRKIFISDLLKIERMACDSESISRGMRIYKMASKLEGLVKFGIDNKWKFEKWLEAHASR